MPPLLSSLEAGLSHAFAYAQDGLQFIVIHTELTRYYLTEALEAAVVKVLLARFGLLRAVFVDDCLGGEVHAGDLARPFTPLFTYLSIPADELEAALLEAEFEVLVILETLFAGQEEVDAEHIVVLLIFRPINAQLFKGCFIAFGPDEAAVVLPVQDVFAALLLAEGDHEDTLFRLFVSQDED